MLTIYYVALLTGGVLVFGSAMSGIGSDVSDLDLDIDVDIDGDFGTEPFYGGGGDTDLGLDDGIHVGDALAGWMPILSLRFWTFFGTFFGAAGAALSAMTALNPVLILSIAIGFGYGLGLSATRLIAKLQSRTVCSRLTEDDYYGQTGRVLIAIGATEMGKVRLHIRGRAVDCFAISQDAERFAAGDSIQVLDIDANGQVTVGTKTEFNLA
jgi:hypothetical protein